MREDIAFRNIMNLIGQYPYASEKEYNTGIDQCQELEKTIEQECSSLQFNLEDLKNNASEMKEKNSGDILPALNYLGQFTYAKDPRICGKDIKRDYLVGVLLFTSTARDYLKMRIEERKYLESVKSQEKSESLQMLLEMNAHEGGLTEEEKVKAYQLITNPKYSEKNCWLCKLNEEEYPAIYDTGLCQGHALYALATRK